MKYTCLILASLIQSSLTYRLNQKGSLLTEDMFDDVDPKEFQAQLDKSDGEEESSPRKGGHVTDDGTVKKFDTSHWNAEK